MMSSNPVQIPIPANSQGSINCIANATYYQRVTLVWAGRSIVFEGSGETQPMRTSHGEDVYLLGAEDNAFVIAALFQYSINGRDGPFQKAKVCAPVVSNKGAFTIIQVASEDGQDNDKNDSLLTIVFATIDRLHNSPSPSLEAPNQPRQLAGNVLNLHAKVYYKEPVSTGDEFIFTVEYDGTEGPVSVRHFWNRHKAEYYDEQTAFGGYIHVAVALFGNTRPGMEEAILTLSTVISYWISRPTGFKSADWTATLRHTSNVITRVTT